MRHGVAVFLATIILLGCAPRVPVVDKNSLSQEQLTAAYNVRIYEFGGQHDAPEYKVALGNVTGHSCKHLLTDPPANKGDALTQLRISAAELGATAVVDVMFDRSGTDTWGTNCWESYTATGMAVR